MLRVRKVEAALATAAVLAVTAAFVANGVRQQFASGDIPSYSPPAGDADPNPNRTAPDGARVVVTNNSERGSVANLPEFRGETANLVNLGTGLNGYTYGRIATPDGQKILVKSMSENTWHVANTSKTGENNTTYQYGQQIEVQTDKSKKPVQIFVTLRNGPNHFNGRPDQELIFATEFEPGVFSYGLTHLTYGNGRPIESGQDFDEAVKALARSLPKRPAQDRSMLNP